MKSLNPSADAPRGNAAKRRAARCLLINERLAVSEFARRGVHTEVAAVINFDALGSVELHAYGVGAASGADHEVVLYGVALAAEEQVNAGIDFAVSDLRERPDVRAPAARVGAESYSPPAPECSPVFASLRARLSAA